MFFPFILVQQLCLVTHKRSLKQRKSLHIVYKSYFIINNSDQFCTAYSLNVTGIIILSEIF